MIVLLGTGHVFDLRARVQEEIHRRAPQVVALELDPARFHALAEKQRDTSGAPLFYRLLAKFQDRVAADYGVEAGDEMLAAADAARDIRVPVALIDMEAQRVFKRIWREMGFMEKARLAGSTLAGLVVPSKTVEQQVDEMQENYAAFFAVLGNRFPTIKRVLIDERNRHMANALTDLSGRNERIVAVMGDGHVDGVQEILEARGLPVEAVRLKELREARADGEGGKGAPGDGVGAPEGASVSFSVEYEY